MFCVRGSSRLDAKTDKPAGIQNQFHKRQLSALKAVFKIGCG